MRLSGSQVMVLRDALADAFDLQTLTMMLRTRLDKKLAKYALEGTFDYRVFELVEASQREGWTDRLIAAAREDNPSNAKLAAVADALNFSPLRPASAGGTAPERLVLQRLVRERSNFIDVLDWRRKLGELEARVCRVEVYGAEIGWGTGFLIGPDLVLTNHHVVEKVISNEIPPGQVLLRFDFKMTEEGVINPGTEISLARGEWLVDNSPPSPRDFEVNGGLPDENQLDYALLRLADKAGDLSIGRNAPPGAPARGWVAIPATPSPEANDILFILQHPDAEPLKLAFGNVLAANGNGTRLRHDANTVGGSSGSPCFNADLSLVALHHAGDPNYDSAHRPEYNQAVPMSRILARLRQQGVELPS